MFIKIKQTILNLIEKLSKIFKIDLKYLARGGSLLTIVQLSSAFFGFLMTLAYANYLSPEVFGTYKYVLAAYTIITLFSLPGIDSAMIETISRGNQGAMWHGLRTKFKWGFLGSLACLIYAFYNFYIGETMLFQVFLLMSIFVPFMESLSLYSSYFNAEKKYYPWAVSEILTQFFSSLSIFLAVYFTNNILVIISTYFLIYIIIRGLVNLYIFKNYNLNNKIDLSYMKYGNQMSLFQIVTRGISTIDQIIVFNVVGAVALAIFSIANAIPTRIQSVLRVTGSLAYPKFADKDEKTIAKTLPLKMFYFGVLILIGCIVYVAISPIFFKIFFPKYLDSVAYTQVLIFYVMSGVTYPFGAFLLMNRRIKDQFTVAILNIIVKIICLVVLVPLYGIWGAVWSVVASSWANIFMAYYILWKVARK